MYKLLIVDDEPQILEGMKYTLNWEKYGVGQIETALSTGKRWKKRAAICAKARRGFASAI